MIRGYPHDFGKLRMVLSEKMGVCGHPSHGNPSTFENAGLRIKASKKGDLRHYF